MSDPQTRIVAEATTTLGPAGGRDIGGPGGPEDLSSRAPGPKGGGFLGLSYGAHHLRHQIPPPTASAHNLWKAVVGSVRGSIAEVRTMASSARATIPPQHVLPRSGDNVGTAFLLLPGLATAAA